MKKKLLIIFLIISIIIFSFSTKEISKEKINSILIVIADKGFDDMQFMIAYSRLKAAGFAIEIANSNGGISEGLKGLEIKSDLKISEAYEKNYISLLLIGGTEVASLSGNTYLEKLCQSFNNSNKIIAAEDLSPLILSTASILDGKKVSSWPTMSGKLEANGSIYNKAIITEDGNIITGMGGSDENITCFTQKYIDLLFKNQFLNNNDSSKQKNDIALQLNKTQNYYWYVMTHNGLTRTGIIYIPSTYNGKKPFSLVFGLHGMAGTGKDFIRRGFNQLADELDFIMIYPDGYNGDWDIVPGRDTKIDDKGYFKILINELKNRFNIDSSRIYLTGHSLGGFMSYSLAYDLSEEITAIAPASGLMYLPQTEKKSIKPVSILHLHAIDDWNVLFDGDKIYESPLSVMKCISFWKKINSITFEKGIQFFDRNEIKGTIWSNIENKTDVALITSPKGGHSWLPFATEQIAEFFYNHPIRKNSIKINYKSLTPYNEVGKPITIDLIVKNSLNIKKITFFKNGEPIGVDYDFPYSFTCNNLSPGKYRLTAIAELNTGELIHSTSNEFILVTRKNIAYNAIATSSTIESKELIAQNTLDGNIFTRWASEYSDPQWIEVDLQNITQISGVTLIWEDAYAAAYDIQTSTDRKNWTTVYSATEATGGTDFISFNPINARYIRMYGNTRATKWGYSIWDFMVHGE
jgi:poly(3-hydroxybutyrate) depolymerase/putative intracellular protease/amidase